MPFPSSMSNSELAKTFESDAVTPGKGKWNPFEDPTPFSQMTEDHIFDAEFDAIRQRGSQTSEFILCTDNMLSNCLLSYSITIINTTS